ncbi:MAG: hypothetical protein HY010_07835 [Acidobacteria bacterium]|nr:hypothetical protein [Acidobacteriota bacterium]
MTNRITNLIHTSTMNTLRLALLSSLVIATPLFASGKHSGQGQDARAKTEQARLVQLVRNATKNYQDVSNLPPGYGPFLGCVSGPDHGAMGVHYVNGDLVGDGKIDVSQPEALIYETANGQTKLVGVEYIVDAATWLANNNNTPPVLEGQTFQLVGIPNRFNIPAPFFELHVWAWRHSPNGAFVDWNDHVTCEGQ